MATEARDTPELLATFGPLRAYQSGQRVDTTVDPDRLVKTHCCFCGQQCGIQRKVKGNQVVGFEPWLDFPFNKGMLCPKGVRRYLQGSHHDRLTSAYFRDPSRPDGSKEAMAYYLVYYCPLPVSASYGTARICSPAPSDCSRF